MNALKISHSVPVVRSSSLSKSLEVLELPSSNEYVDALMLRVVRSSDSEPPFWLDLEGARTPRKSKIKDRARTFDPSKFYAKKCINYVHTIQYNVTSHGIVSLYIPCDVTCSPNHLPLKPIAHKKT